MEVIDGYYYTKEHEWISIEDGVATVGITDYAQSNLGDITFVELPAVDADVEQFEQFSSIESVKAASDIYAPLSGRVIEVNAKLDANPQIINKDCYEKGWIAKIEMSNEGEASKLMNAEEYRNYLESCD